MKHKFNQGDIVYWCHSDGNGKYHVRYGMVDEQFSDAVVIDYLSPRERRLIDGVPIDRFESESRYRKLPKNWSYDTELFEITYSKFTKEEIDFRLDLTDPKTIQEAYQKGYLVKDSEIFHGDIEAEITKDGFRIVKKYPMWKHHIDHVSILPYKVHFTYAEALKEVEDNIAEFQRQAALSDYDWSVEQIDNTLGIYQKVTDCSDKEIQEYRKWLLSMSNVEDIETRIYGCNIQWKYLDHKRWNYIEL